MCIYFARVCKSVQIVRMSVQEGISAYNNGDKTTTKNAQTTATMAVTCWFVLRTYVGNFIIRNSNSGLTTKSRIHNQFCFTTKLLRQRWSWYLQLLFIVRQHITANQLNVEFCQWLHWVILAKLLTLLRLFSQLHKASNTFTTFRSEVVCLQ